MGIRRRLSGCVHSPLARRLAPEWLKDLYRRGRNRVQRAFYDPRRFWTRFGRTYMERFPPVGQRSEDLFIRTVAGLGAGGVLDVGCGYGRYLLALRRGMTLRRLAGIDISPTQVERAREYLKDYPDIELVVGPATRLPWPDGAFDVVLTYSLMIHLRPAELDEFLDEARRVSGGWGVFLESSSNPDRPHLNPPYYFAHDYERAFARHGIAVTRVHSVNERTREYLYVVRFGPPARRSPECGTLT